MSPSVFVTWSGVPVTPFRRRLATALAGTAFALLSALPVSATAAPPFPEPVPDDNGHYAFARESVPVLLGRKPRGALEVKLLGDIAELHGREAMLGMLMQSDEYVAHWGDQLMDILRLQRGGQRGQDRACFDRPLRDEVSSLLAVHIRGSASTDPASGGPFNMHDVALSAVAGDLLDAPLRAYLFPLAIERGRRADGEANARSNLARHFGHTYINRDTACLACHNERDAVTDASSGWNRHHPVEIGIDRRLFGSAYGSRASDLSNLFRTDQGVERPAGAPLAAGAHLPWGIDARCVTFSPRGRNPPPDRVGFRRPGADAGDRVSFAGIEGDDRYVADIDEALRRGNDRLRSEALVLVDEADYPLPLPASTDVALSFSVALSFVDQVWERVTGARLTIDNYFPRNPAQRDALHSLTETVFLPRWSLRELLTEILLSGYTDRRAPRNSLRGEPYTLPTILDPWVARDPRGADAPPPTPLNTRNGQGELVVKHEPAALMRQAATALGLPGPRLFGAAPYGAELQHELGRYRSQNEPGHDGFDLQTMLAWEEVHGLCARGTNPWLDRLVGEVATYDAAHPFTPLSLLDVLETMRDWLLQESTIGTGSGSGPDSGEIAALSALFSVDPTAVLPLTTPVSVYVSLAGQNVFRENLRSACGAYLSSPQFMLKGISKRTPLTFPALRVCHADDDCSYAEMCESRTEALASLGHPTRCLEDDVLPGRGGSGIPEFVDACLSEPLLCDLDLNEHLCLSSVVASIGRGRPLALDCPIDGPRCDPRCAFGGSGGFGGGPFGGFGGPGGVGVPNGLRGAVGGLGGGELGLPCCGGLGRADRGLPERLGRDDVVAWLEGARVRRVDDVLILTLSSGKTREPRLGERLAFGDVLVLPVGASIGLAHEGRALDFTGPPKTARAASRRAGALERELTVALARDDASAVKRWLSRGADPRALDASGRPLLELAATARANESAALLKEALARLDRLGRAGDGAPAPRTIAVAGPSAAKAPHPRGGSFLSSIERLDARPVKRLDTKARVELLDKFGHLGREPDDAERKALDANRSNLLERSPEERR